MHPSRQVWGVDQALGLPALYAGTKILSDNAASLPIKLYTTMNDGRKLPYTGPHIFQNPSVLGTTYDWMFSCMASLTLQGNAWGIITGRDGFGFPTGIEWVPPEWVIVEGDEGAELTSPLSRKVYVAGRQFKWFGPDKELFHVKGYTLPGRLAGVSPMMRFALTITAGHEAQRYGTSWYESGGFPPGTFQNSELEVDPTQADMIRKMLVTSLRRREPLVYGRDWDYTPVTVPPSEAQFIEAMQLTATHIAAVLDLPPNRLGGKSGDSLTYNCVMPDTEILTQRGWLRYDEVTTADTTLTLNHENGTAEWQPVQAVHVFENDSYPVLEMGNSSHSSATTPNHRWPVLTQAGRVWKTTDTLTSDSRVTMAAPVVAPAEAKWSDALTELVAWFWTEGWHNKYGSVTLTQSQRVNPQNVTRIRQALTEVFGPAGELQVRSVPSWREDYTEASNCVHFRLNAKAGRQLLAHAPDKIVSTEFLSQLTRAQLELFYQTSIDADGTRRPGNQGEVLAQKDRARTDAFQIAAALTGRAGVVRQNSKGMWVLCVRTKAFTKPVNHAKPVLGLSDLVWCVQTENKSWFARRNGTCYFTGNTVEQNQLQVIEALRPWLVRLEYAFSDLLPSKRVISFNTDALLKTDLKTRTEIYQIQRNIGLRSTDELRELEDLPPLPNGAGSESLPLQLMVSMAQRAGALPKSMLDQVVLLIDIAGKKLEGLQKKGITKTPPGGDFTQDPTDPSQSIGPANSPGQFYANMLNSYARELDTMGKHKAADILRQSDVQLRIIQSVDPKRFTAEMPDKAVREMVENYDDVKNYGLDQRKDDA